MKIDHADAQAHPRRRDQAVTDVLRQIVLPKFDTVRMTGGGFMARCPAHDDGKASLSISYGQTQPVVFMCHAGCDSTDILAALELDWADLSNPVGNSERSTTGADTWMPCKHTKVAEYLYRDQHGQVVLGVARCEQKCFAQWRPDPTSRSGRRWSITLPDGTKAGAGIPYRLPEVLADRDAVVHIVEGEKDADRLWDDLDMPATCNAGGAGKWTPRHAAWLAGFDVCVIADRDAAGRSHAVQVVETLLPIAASIIVVQAATGKDVSDHLDAGESLGALLHVATPKPRALVGAA